MKGLVSNDGLLASKGNIPELDAVGRNEIVRDSLDYTSLRLKSVYLRPDHWFRAEVLPVAVAGIGEPQVAGMVVLRDIVETGEVAAVEAVQKHAAFVCRWVHQRESRSVVEVALIGKDDLLALAAVGR